MARELRGAHVVVVGASGGLGAQVAAHLARAGARVSAIVRDHARLDGASVSQYALADVTDHEALRTAFASVAPFDGVVNAVGVVAFGNVTDLDDATLARLFAVNAIAPIVMLRESAGHMSDGDSSSTSPGWWPLSQLPAWRHTAHRRLLRGRQ